MNTIDINFSEFGPPVKLIIIDPKKYKSRFKSTLTSKSKKIVYPSFHIPFSNQVQQRDNVNINSVNQVESNKSARVNETSATNCSDFQIPVETNPQPNPNASHEETTHTSDTNESSYVEEVRDDESIEDNEESFLSSEQTTRVGRICKKPKMFNHTAEKCSDSDSGPPKVKVKKRKAADKFRCKTCSKYYVGNTKLRLHYKKNPDHKVPISPSSPPVVKQNETPNTSGAESLPDIILVKSCTSVGVQADMSDPTNRSDAALILLNSSSSDNPSLSLDIGPNNSSSAERHPRRRILEPITVPLTSGNVMSPGENSMNAAMTHLNDQLEYREFNSNNDQPNHTSMSSDSNRAFNNVSMQFPIPTDERPSPPSLANAVESTQLSPRLPNSMTEQDRSSSPCPVETIVNCNESSNHSVLSVNTSSLDGLGTDFFLSPNNDASSRKSPINVENTENRTGIKEGTGKLVWEFIEEKMLREGINQILSEISDVAEKLGRIARDKIIPIREEEEERLQNSVPIIQVDNPFMSHLLDLPFGTYIFKEDDEDDMRRRRPSPVTELSQLSLTGGSEVDIDKFLRPDSVLPHLTNLDFNSICNNNSNHAS